MASQEARPEATDQESHADWWAIGKPQGQDLGQVVICELDLNTQTLWVASTTHDIRVIAYEDLRPEEVPRLGSHVIQLDPGQNVAMLGQVGTWNVLELSTFEDQKGAVDEIIPPSARMAAQRMLLFGLLLGGVILVKMAISAAETAGVNPEEALLRTSALAATLMCIGGAAMLWKRILPWFAPDPRRKC